VDQSEAPAEIRTFLIADVRGYTLFTQERGDEAAAKLAARFAQVAREGIEARGGSLIELRGDEALAVFASPRQALRSATDLQTRFADETIADPSLPLPVGIGLDAGEAVAVEGGYRGGALNLAARLCGQAGPGEVLASREVVHLARKIEGLRYVERGAVHLKNLDEPVHVVRVIPEDREDPATLFATVLAPPKPKPTTSTPPPTLARKLFPHGLRSRRGLVAGLALLLVAAGIPLLVDRDTTPPGLPGIDTDSVGIIDLHSTRIVAQVKVGSRPGAVAFGHGAVWVANEEAGTVSRIDPETRAVVDSIEVGTDPVAIAVSDDAVWVANSGDGTVMRISPDTDGVVATIETGNGPAGIAVGQGSVWVTNLLDGTLARIDPDSSAVTARVNAGANPTTIAAAANLWVTNSTTGTVSRLDARSATLLGAVHVGNGPTSVVVAEDDVWVANEPDGTVSHIDATTGAVGATIPVGQGPVAVAIGQGSAWVANGVEGSVVRIDPDSNAVVDTIEVGNAPSGLAIVGDDELWVTTRAAASVHRGGTLTLVAGQPPVLDPAIGFDPVSWALLNITNDGLVGLRQTGGPAATTIVPNLAISVPEPTDGGRTYTFQLRTGIRYSSGAELTATDMRSTFERFFESGQTLPFFNGIVGAEACLSDPSDCDLSDGIVTDDAGGTVTFHLTEPDPEFLLKLALPLGSIVPTGTPLSTEDSVRTVPATGPYMFETVTAERIELVRNPHFVEWSHTAKPDGYPDRISLEIGEDPAELIGWVEQGKADSYLHFVPPEPPQELATRYPNQVHLYALSRLHYLFMRTSRPPFDDVRVRQALNFAIDRDEMARIFGGTLAVRPTCQVLPPNFQGYQPYCPYTLSPSPDGEWTAPDLDTARQLVRESGTEGMSITLAYPPFWPEEGRPYLVSLLEDLGYRVSLNPETPPEGVPDYSGSIFDSRSDVQVGGLQWGADYPAASQFVDVLLSCAAFVPNSGANLNLSQFCDPAIDAKVSQALELQVSDQSAAGALWAEIDRALVDAAAIVPLFNSQGIDFLSARVGNYQHHPLFGLLISQLWVQ